MIMTITTTQRHTPAESVNERTSGRRIDAVQQFASFRITETGNTDEAGKFTITHTPIGSLSRQSDTLSRINREPDLVALTANDQTLYTGGFDQDNKTIELYTDVAKTTPAENLVGVKVSYWYYAPIKGTLNDDGTFTPEAIITPVDSDGNEKFTDANPGAVQLSGSNEVQVNSSALPTGASTEATLALIKAKTDNIPSDPSKESGKLTALETLITTLNGKIDTLNSVIDSIKDTDGIKKITDTVDVQLSGSNLEVAAVVNVTTAGTRQQLPDKACREVTIIAKRGNTGYIYVGKDDVSSTVFGAELGELDSITLAVSNTNQIYIDASVSGEGISYVAI